MIPVPREFLERVIESDRQDNPEFECWDNCDGYDDNGEAEFVDGPLAKEARGYMEQGGWVSVDERLPQVWEDVLVFGSENASRGPFVEEAQLDEYCVWKAVRTDAYGDSIVLEVTHWMPLPEPPRCKEPANE